MLQHTDAGDEPVTGAAIEFDPFTEFPVAETQADRDGRYFLCGLPTNDSVFVEATVDGTQYGYVVVPPGQTTADIVVSK